MSVLVSHYVLIPTKTKHPIIPFLKSYFKSSLHSGLPVSQHENSIATEAFYQPWHCWHQKPFNWSRFPAWSRLGSCWGVWHVFWWVNKQILGFSKMARWTWVETSQRGSLREVSATGESRYSILASVDYSLMVPQGAPILQKTYRTGLKERVILQYDK